MRYPALREAGEEHAPLGWQRVEMPRPDPPITDLQPPAVVRVPVRRFRGSHSTIEASKPVEVTFTLADDLCLAENETLSIYATGETIEDALSDFIDQVVYFFHYYRSLPDDDVIGEAVRLRRLYLAGFKEIESS